jgi:hypothetical protein
LSDVSTRIDDTTGVAHWGPGTYRPEVLSSLLSADAIELFSEGLLREYAHCAASGEMDRWEACGHAIITLIADAGRRVSPAAADAYPVAFRGE